MILHLFAAKKIAISLVGAALVAVVWLGVFTNYVEPLPVPSQASPTSQSVSGLKDYVDRRFEALERLLDERRMSSQTAIDKADVATEKRFELSNAVREQLATQANTFATKVALQNLEESVNALETQSNITRGIVIAIGLMFGFFKWYTGRNPPTRRIADILPPKPPE